eukprot:GFYU01033394.1.p1 GENE.GFYU01033394.1~~GFYU01033394.1.p1  ORF type:complete len:567 (-),score=158.77 GFYU01033394.1:205-1905(-)
MMRRVLGDVTNSSRNRDKDEPLTKTSAKTNILGRSLSSSKRPSSTASTRPKSSTTASSKSSQFQIYQDQDLNTSRIDDQSFAKAQSNGRSRSAHRERDASAGRHDDIDVGHALEQLKVTEASPRKSTHLPTHTHKHTGERERERTSPIRTTRTTTTSHYESSSFVTPKQNKGYLSASSKSTSSTTSVTHENFLLSPNLFSVQKNGSVKRNPLKRQASIVTSAVLDALPHCSPEKSAENMLHRLSESHAHLSYFCSEAFARDVILLCSRVEELLLKESKVLELQSPLYVFGDIHGNMTDLLYFSKNIWTFGMSLTAGKFLFLGDYVDRGLEGLEVIAYLFAQKTNVPEKLFLLRGNHELRKINGWEAYYKEGSFLRQCRNRFGSTLGHEVWEAVNCVFDAMPYAAVIDQRVFCVHGGIPRQDPRQPDDRLANINAIPARASVDPPCRAETELSRQLAMDLMWSDPAEEESMVDPESGFGPSVRGPQMSCFGIQAITNFLDRYNFSHIIRAHQAMASGVSVSKAAKVITVFSTSKDHIPGGDATCGCLLVEANRITPINREHISPAAY